MFTSKWLYIPFNWEVSLRTCEKTLWYSKATGREWSSGLTRCDQIWKVPGPDPTRQSARFRDPNWQSSR